MLNYILRRLMIAVPSLLGISVVLFTVLALAPGDPFEELATNPNVPPEVRMALRAQFGLDDPIWERYVRWLMSMLKGDWGFSFVSRVGVDQLILQRLPTTIIVIGLSQLLAILVALPVGVLAAVKPYSWFDRIASTIAFIGFSLPTFFTGVIFILFFSIYLGWLPFVYRSDISATGWQFLWEHFKQSIMPIAVLGLFQAASMMRYVRSAVLDVVRLDYVTTARSKGLSERKVILKHVVRNALIPVVTLVALQMPAVFGLEVGIFILIVVVIGGFRWMPVARLVRAQFFSLREKEFVEAARALGASTQRQVVRHILPNSLGPVIVAATIDVAAAIIAESTLSFLGLGFPPDIPTWGRILYDGRDYMDLAVHWALFPGLAIFVTVLTINFIGDGLRDALDPRRVL